MKFVAFAGLGGLVVVVLLVLGIAGATSTSATPPAGGCAVAPTVATSVGAAPAAGDPATTVGQKTATLDAAQMAVAQVIVAVGKGSGITQRGTAIALMTAMQESTLHPGAVSGRSVGLFQQQGSLYAGFDRTLPAAATAAFYRQLVARVPNYDDPSVDMATAAQTVQQSGAGVYYYVAWESWATELAAQLYTGAAPTTGIQAGIGGGVTCAPGGGHGPIPVTVTGELVVHLPPQAGVAGTVTAPTAQVATVLAAALSWLGEPYVWGGGDQNGPTAGEPEPGGPPRDAAAGFDCSGLVLYAYAQIGVTLPHSSAQQLAMASATDTAPFSQAIPGDLLFWGTPVVHHVALYLGRINGVALEVTAPETGGVVEVTPVPTGGDFRGVAVTPW